MLLDDHIVHCHMLGPIVGPIVDISLNQPRLGLAQTILPKLSISWDST